MKKIIVTVRQFIPSYNQGTLDVDSRMYNEDLTPIFDTREGHENSQLGQVSSNLLWAVQDIPNHFKAELDIIFPVGYEFEFYYIPLHMVRTESKKWWSEMSNQIKLRLITEFFPNEEDGLSDIDIENMWANKAMIHTATKILKPVNLNNIVV